MFVLRAGSDVWSCHCVQQPHSHSSGEVGRSDGRRGYRRLYRMLDQTCSQPGWLRQGCPSPVFRYIVSPFSRMDDTGLVSPARFQPIPAQADQPGWLNKPRIHRTHPIQLGDDRGRT